MWSTDGDIGSGDFMVLSTYPPQIAQVDCVARINFLFAVKADLNLPA
jgi:hypothetical protein